MAEIIREKQEKNKRNNARVENWGEIDKRLLESDKETDKFYIPLFSNDSDYGTRLEEDVRIECGCNAKGEEKIHMISFGTRP